MRQIPEEEQLYRGVSAPQRKAVSEQAEVTEMPKVRAAVPHCFGQGARSSGRAARNSIIKTHVMFLPAEDCFSGQHNMRSAESTAGKTTAFPYSSEMVAQQHISR